MHSSLPQQLGNFKFSRSRALRWAFEVFERMAVRRSRVVIVICAELERLVREIAPESAPVLIENAPGAGDVSLDGGRESVRADFSTFLDDRNLDLSELSTLGIVFLDEIGQVEGAGETGRASPDEDDVERELLALK